MNRLAIELRCLTLSVRFSRQPERETYEISLRGAETLVEAVA